jgi:hypothetical protein
VAGCTVDAHERVVDGVLHLAGDDALDRRREKLRHRRQVDARFLQIGLRKTEGFRRGVEGVAHPALDFGVDQQRRGGGLHLTEHDAGSLCTRRVGDHLDLAAGVGEHGLAEACGNYDRGHAFAVAHAPIRLGAAVTGGRAPASARRAAR